MPATTPAMEPRPLRSSTLTAIRRTRGATPLMPDSAEAGAAPMIPATSVP